MNVVEIVAFSALIIGSGWLIVRLGNEGRKTKRPLGVWVCFLILMAVSEPALLYWPADFLSVLLALMAILNIVWALLILRRKGMAIPIGHLVLGFHVFGTVLFHYSTQNDAYQALGTIANFFFVLLVASIYAYVMRQRKRGYFDDNDLSDSEKIDA